LLSYIKHTQLLLPLLLGTLMLWVEFTPGTNHSMLVDSSDLDMRLLSVMVIVAGAILLLFRQLHLTLLLGGSLLIYSLFHWSSFAVSSSYYLSILQLVVVIVLCLAFCQRDGYLPRSFIFLYLLVLIAGGAIAIAQPISMLQGLIRDGHLLALTLGVPLIAILVSLLRGDGQRIVLFFASLVLTFYMQRSQQVFNILFVPFMLYILWFAIVDLSQRVWLDKLTGIAGRARFDSDIQSVGRGSWVAILDVDHFKKFNDSHGHLNGDRALQSVARVLDRVSGAKAFRFGGEEFVLLIKAQSQEKLKLKLEALLQKLAKNKVSLVGGKRSHAKLTASIGCAKYTGSSSASEVLKSADQALYRAKAKGRNRAEIAKS